MARRNHSRRAHAPFESYPGIGYAEDPGGRPEGGGRGPVQAGEGPEGGYRVVSERPYTSLMTAFGVGFGLGLVVSLLLSRDEEEGWFERYAPDAIQDLPDRMRKAGHKVSESMSGSLRQAGNVFSESVAGPLKHAGETVASYVPSAWKRW